MRKHTITEYIIAAVISCGVLVAIGCGLSERGRQGADFVSKSTKSAASNASPAQKPGMNAVAGMAEQVSREAGKPKTLMASVDFSRDTADQEAVVVASSKIEEYKKQLDAKEALIASLKNWGLGALMACLSVLGIKGVWVIRLIGGIKKARALYDEKADQVTSLVEGTCAVIDQAKTKGVDAALVKKIMKKVQEAHGTRSKLMPIVDEIGKLWSLNTEERK